MSHVALGGDFGVIAHCTRCGDVLRATALIRLDGVVAAIGAFRDQHRACGEPTSAAGSEDCAP